MRGRADWSARPASPAAELESIDASLELLLRARARSEAPRAHAEGRRARARASGARRRRTVRRWARELGIPERLAEAVSDGLFDPPTLLREGDDEGVTVHLLRPVGSLQLAGPERLVAWLPARVAVHSR